MICRNLTEYYNIFFNKLAFQYYQYDNFSLYINPQQPEEFIIHVHIADMYELFVGDFTAPYDLSLIHIFIDKARTRTRKLFFNFFNIIICSPSCYDSYNRYNSNNQQRIITTILFLLTLF